MKEPATARRQVSWRDVLTRQDDFHWLLRQNHRPRMRVPGLVFATDELVDEMADDEALKQIANVATLPGIVRYSFAMPDVHSLCEGSVRAAECHTARPGGPNVTSCLDEGLVG